MNIDIQNTVPFKSIHSFWKLIQSRLQLNKMNKSFFSKQFACIKLYYKLMTIGFFFQYDATNGCINWGQATTAAFDVVPYKDGKLKFDRNKNMWYDCQ